MRTSKHRTGLIGAYAKVSGTMGSLQDISRYTKALEQVKRGHRAFENPLVVANILEEMILSQRYQDYAKKLYYLICIALKRAIGDGVRSGAAAQSVSKSCLLDPVEALKWYVAY